MMIDRPRITRAGLEALAEAQARGKKLSFVGLALGTASYDPTGDELGLRSPKERAAIADSNRVSGHRVHLTAAFTDAVEPYEVGELGIIAQLEGASETLVFAILSKAGAILAKRIPSEELLLGVDILTEEMPEGVIQVTGVGERLNLSIAKEFAAVALSLTQSQRQTLELMRDLATARAELAQVRREFAAQITELQAFQSRAAVLFGDLARPGPERLLLAHTFATDGPVNRVEGLSLPKSSTRPLAVGYSGAQVELFPQTPLVSQLQLRCVVEWDAGGAVAFTTVKVPRGPGTTENPARFILRLGEVPTFRFDATATGDIAALNAPGTKASFSIDFDFTELGGASQPPAQLTPDPSGVKTLIYVME